MFTFLLVLQAIIAAALVAVVLMQQSEGGGLTGGGSPAGLMSARGAANFLTRTTTILACLFVGLSIALAVIASVKHAPSDIDTTLAKDAAVPVSAPASPQTPAGSDPLAGAAQTIGNGTATDQGVPLAR